MRPGFSQIVGTVLLCGMGLLGCADGGSSTEQASPASTAREGQGDDPPTIHKVSAAGRADDPNPVGPASGTEQPAPAPAAPRAVADPGCEADCRDLGLCVRRNGRCSVGTAEHCRQSDACLISGACSTREMRNDDGTPFLLCGAATDEDCTGAKTCKEWGNCKALDGSCTNPADPETVKYRADKVKNVRDLALKITQGCEATKAETLRIFREDGFPDPAASWAKFEGLDRELIGVVIDFRRQTVAHYDILFDLLDNDEDLLGAGCYEALKDGVTKGKDGCMFNGSKLDTTWLKTLAKAECDG